MVGGLSGTHGPIAVLAVELVQNQEAEHVRLQNHPRRGSFALVKRMQLKNAKK